jgi:photosystem II stability/assembly factor-like uncharacterized protein
MSRVLACCSMVILLGLAFAQTIAPDSPAAAPRLDGWKIIGPGGGGAQYHPTISPHDSKRVLINCDMTGAYLTLDGGNTWRMFNLRGTVSFFLFDPVDPATIYASSAGLYRSSDSGKTWQLIFPEPESVTGIEMADDHAGARIATRDNKHRMVRALAVDPSDSKTLFAAIAEDQSMALHSSRDRGKTWTLESPLPDGARALYIDPRSPAKARILYVAGNKTIAVREGGNWKSGSAPAGSASLVDVSVGFPKDGGKPVFYAVASSGRGRGSSIWVSEDGGMSWREAPLAAAPPAPNITAVATGLNQPDTAYASYNRLRTDPSSGDAYFGVARSGDRGKTWKPVWREARTSSPNIRDIWISALFGPGWGENPFHLGVAPSNPNLCFGTDWGRTMRTTDGGETWEGAYSKKLPGGFTTTGIDVTTNYGVHFDPFDRKHILISYTDIGLFSSIDGGTTWTGATTGVPKDWQNTTYWVEFDPEVKGRIWGVMSGTHDLPRPKMWRQANPDQYKGGVCLSEDGGKNWKQIATNLPQTAATHILIDPKSPASARVLYITGFGRGVFKSMDGGQTWTLKNLGIEGRQTFAWRLARDRNGVLYLVVARKSEDGSIGNEQDGALYRSSDGAEHWEKMQLPEGLNGPNGISVDSEDPQRLYLAAWGRRGPRTATQGGVFLSADGGRSWRNVLEKDQHIYDVTIDPRNPKILYACGFESSAWRSTDRGSSWQRIKGYNFKWGHRVIPDPYNPGKIFINTFGGSVWYGPATGDPSAVEDITTPQVSYSSRQ